MTGFEPATPATRTQCATKLRYIPIFYIFCILSTLTQFGFNWNLASVPLAKCAIPIFYIYCILSTLTQFGFNWNLASVSLAKYAIPIFYIYCILSTLTQFGFNWNLASVSLAKCATFRFLYVLLVHSNKLYNNIIPKKLKIKPIFMKNFNR